MKPQKAAGLPVGGPSLMAAFLLLALMLLAVFSFLFANRDAQLSNRAAEHVTMYYAADSMAEEIRRDCERAAPNGEWSEVTKAWPELSFTIEKEGDKTTVAYAVPIKEKMELSVQLSFSPGEKGRVLAWQQVNTLVIEDTPVILELPVF